MDLVTDELKSLKDQNDNLKKEVKTLFDNRKAKCVKGTTDSFYEKSNTQKGCQPSMHLNPSLNRNR